MNMPLLRDLYTLTATLDGITSRKSLRAFSDEEAMSDAIHKILAYAHVAQTGPWAKGRIELTDPNGYIIEVMEAK
jgi:hypothetical protein